MERAVWTDERLDDLAEGMRSGFVRLDEDLRALRSEVHAGDQGLRTEMREGFSELRLELGGVRGELGGVRGELGELRRVVMGFGGGIIVALIGVIAAILARGA